MTPVAGLHGPGDRGPTHVTPADVVVLVASIALSLWLSRPLDGSYRPMAVIAAAAVAMRAVDAAGTACYATTDGDQLTLWEPYRPRALDRHLRFGTVDIVGETTVTPKGRTWWGEQLVQVGDEAGRTIVLPHTVLRWARDEVRRDARRRAPGVWPPS